MGFLASCIRLGGDSEQRLLECTSTLERFAGIKLDLEQLLDMIELKEEMEDQRSTIRLQVGRNPEEQSSGDTDEDDEEEQEEEEEEEDLDEEEQEGSIQELEETEHSGEEQVSDEEDIEGHRSGYCYVVANRGFGGPASSES